VRDEEYSADQIPAYGLRTQPHLAKRGRQTLTTVLIGTALALLSTLAALVAVIGYPSLIGEAGQSEVRVGLWCALGMLLITGYQSVSWYLAWQEWLGRRDFNLNAFALVSYIIQFVSYAVVLAGMWFILSAMLIAGVATLAFWMLAVALIALVAAQIIAATEYLRSSGPAGTVPGHMRALIAFNKTRNSTTGGRRSNLDLD